MPVFLLCLPVFSLCFLLLPLLVFDVAEIKRGWIVFQSDTDEFCNRPCPRCYEHFTSLSRDDDSDALANSITTSAARKDFSDFVK